MGKKDNYNKLLDQVKIIADKPGMEIMDILGNKDLGICDKDPQYSPHTILKLSYLNYYLGVFLPIANKYSDNVVFIDVFSGSGLVKIKNTEYTVLGSSLLAAKSVKNSRKGHNKKYGFDKIISIELEKDKAELLNSRFKALNIQNARALCGDSNDIISNLTEECKIENNSIVLLFIDPEGMEPIFNKYIQFYDSVHRVDTIMNYSWGVIRVQGKLEKHLDNSDYIKLEERMKNFIPNYTVGDNPDEKFLEFFENEFGKPMGSGVNIHDIGKKIAYSMILRINKTNSNTKWKEAMKDIENEISRHDDKTSLELLRTTLSGKTFF